MSVPPAPYRLHGYDVSYFTAKVRPALRYKRLWHEELRADYAEIRRRTGLTFIPIVITPDDETWQDSTEILAHLEERHPEPPLFPGTPVQRFAGMLVELYVDEFAVTVAMHTRWGSELAEKLARARFCAMIGDAELGNAAADRMSFAAKMVGATPETAPALEAHLRELLDAENAHFETHPYLLGDRMSFADCALMGPQYGHFFVDPLSRQMLLETAVPVVGWIERCSTPNPESQGAWLPGDTLAPTFREVLRAMGRDAVPVLIDSLRAYDAWADGRPAEMDAPPRMVGPCKSQLRGTPFERGVGSYTAWSVGRVLDAYRALDDADRAHVDDALAGSGWEELLSHELRHRLAKRGFELVFA